MAQRQKGIRDHARNRSHPNIDNKAISQQLEDLVKPCVYSQLAYYRSLGMRERICAVVDLQTRYPVKTWFNERPYHHESNFQPQLLELIPAQILLLLERGFWNYDFFDQLITGKSDFVTRLKANAKYKSVSILSQSQHHCDRLICLGNGYQGNPVLGLRLVEIKKRSRPQLL